MKLRNVMQAHVSADADAIEARRRDLLNVLLLATAAAALVLLVATLLLRRWELAGDSHETRALWIGLVIFGVSLPGLFVLNRYTAPNAAAILFVLVLTATITLSDEPRQVAEGRTVFMFVIPILVASVVLEPWTTFATAGLSSLIAGSLSVLVLHTSPNIPAMAGLFVVALTSYLSANGFKRALERERNASARLRETVTILRELAENIPGSFVRQGSRK